LNIEFELHIAYNGKEALEMLKANNPIKPDLILLDLSMPKMTTSSEPGNLHNAEKYRIKGYFIKPISYTDNTRKADSMEAFIQFHFRHILTP
jgi:CheY-like chemotaxis protein